VGIIIIFDVTEFEIRQAASDFSKILSALAIMNLPSTCSNLPFAAQLKLLY
jgi:hypothetical protein